MQNENTQPIGSSESDARQQLEFENELLREPLQVRELRVEELEMTNRLLVSLFNLLIRTIEICSIVVHIYITPHFKMCLLTTNVHWLYRV